MQVQRRTWLKNAAGVMLLGVAAPRVGAAAAGKGKTVKLVAQRFHFTPSEITVPAGVPVSFELTALDFIHGFNVPDLKQRINLVPGKAVKLELTFPAPGRYAFLCDNFCGDGHEEMNGMIVAV